MLGAQSDDVLLGHGGEPRPWADADENATATINYTSGTTAQPKGVELTHRNIWLNSTVLALHRRLTRAGAPALGVEVRIAPDGEILARANHVLKGYWRRPDETAEALAGGWLHTGDGGTFEDGYLTVSDRKKDMIITGGENVASIEVENRLRSHPAVGDVAVIGVPDLRWGETIKACVVPAPGTSVTGGELIAHARSGLAHYKAPTSVEFLASLPRTVTGKVQKYVLRERYAHARNDSVGRGWATIPRPRPRPAPRLRGDGSRTSGRSCTC